MTKDMISPGESHLAAQDVEGPQVLASGLASQQDLEEVVQGHVLAPAVGTISLVVSSHAMSAQHP